MRGVLMAASVLAVAGCSEGERATGSVQTESADRSMSDAMAPPGVNPTAAPGVAWTYDTAFRLDDGRISQVQEAHAAACEALGVARCRIVGLNYTVDENETVEGRLEVKLEPAIARQFGKNAAATVDRADGRLISTEFTGQDVGAQVSTAGDRRRLAAAELQRIERQLARSDLGDEERARLREQAAELRQAIDGARATIGAGEVQLASTPMTLRYYGDGGVPGFNENPFRAAWGLFVQSVVLLVGFVLKALAVLLPWGLLLALLIALWRSPPLRAVRGWLSGRGRRYFSDPEPQ